MASPSPYKPFFQDEIPENEQLAVTEMLTRLIQIFADLRYAPMKRLRPADMIRLSRGIGTLEYLAHEIQPQHRTVVDSETIASVDQALGSTLPWTCAAFATNSRTVGTPMPHGQPGTRAEGAQAKGNGGPDQSPVVLASVMAGLDDLIQEMRHRQEEATHLRDLYEKVRGEKDAHAQQLQASVDALVQTSIDVDKESKAELRYLRNKVDQLENFVLQHLNPGAPGDGQAWGRDPLSGADHGSFASMGGGQSFVTGRPAEPTSVPPHSASLFSAPRTATAGRMAHSPGSWGALEPSTNTSPLYASDRDSWSPGTMNAFTRFSRDAKQVEDSHAERQRRLADLAAEFDSTKYVW